jgi:hypothetical protein
MEKNTEVLMDERDLLKSRLVGFSMIALGIYGLLYAFKIYKVK